MFQYQDKVGIDWMSVVSAFLSMAKQAIQDNGTMHWVMAPFTWINNAENTLHSLNF